MKYLLAAVIMLALATPALAKVKKAPELDPEVCKRLVAYQPEAGASVEYQPGVDVHGKPVVGPDLNPSPVQVPQAVTFDINVDVATYAGIPVPDKTETFTKIGTVQVDPQGHMTFNGKPMEGDAEAALRALCTTPPPEPPQAKDKHNQ